MYKILKLMDHAGLVDPAVPGVSYRTWWTLQCLVDPAVPGVSYRTWWTLQCLVYPTEPHGPWCILQCLVYPAVPGGPCSAWWTLQCLVEFCFYILFLQILFNFFILSANMFCRHKVSDGALASPVDAGLGIAGNIALTLPVFQFWIDRVQITGNSANTVATLLLEM